jgi:nucleoside-diphosphate-sugar epimerase
MMDKNAKIYVAGHRGMVGSAIVRELQKQGYGNIITRSHGELDLTRQDAVEALVWLGSDYLPDLMAFVTDPDELVRETARDGCDIFIDAIEDERLRVRTIKAFTAHLSDPNVLQTTLAKLESVKESLALETLNDILKDGTTAAREAAKE